MKGRVTSMVSANTTKKKKKIKEEGKEEGRNTASAPSKGAYKWITTSCELTYSISNLC